MELSKYLSIFHLGYYLDLTENFINLFETVNTTSIYQSETMKTRGRTSEGSLLFDRETTLWVRKKKTAPPL